MGTTRFKDKVWWKLIKIEKRIYNGWTEMDKAYKRNPQFDVKPIFKKWQYIYSKDGNKISLVQFTQRMYGKHCWEIYQLNGSKLLEDVERFTSKNEAEIRIEELME